MLRFVSPSVPVLGCRNSLVYDMKLLVAQNLLPRFQIYSQGYCHDLRASSTCVLASLDARGRALKAKDTRATCEEVSRILEVVEADVSHTLGHDLNQAGVFLIIKENSGSKRAL